MKRILTWVDEEKIAVTILLLGIGVILNSPPSTFVFSGILIYGSIIIITLHLLHKLYLKYKK